MGKLVAPKKPIKDTDDDRAHVDADAEKVIHFLKATDGHQYLVDKVLKQSQGLTFDVFKEAAAAEKEASEEPPAEEEAPRNKEPEEALPRTVFVKDVVREPRMHFFKVPRLGSYLAVRLEYSSCLFEEALDAAVADSVEMRNKLKEQEEEKKAHLEKLLADVKDSEDPNFDPHKAAAARKWEELKPKPFKAQTVQFVVCLNTLGQDREFTPDEIRFAQRTVREYAAQWEVVERRNLEADVQLRLASIQADQEYKQQREPADLQEIEKKAEECILPKEGEEPMDEEAKALAQRKLRHKLATRAFYVSEKDARPRFREHKQFGADGQPEGPLYVPLPPNQWRESILAFTKYHVIKMARVFQSVFYLLGYTREEICERDTNKLEWKKAKLLIAANEGADFFKRLGEFNPFGPKDAQFKAYQKLKFIKTNTKRFETALDALEEYSVPLARLFKWLLMSVEYRQLDVLARRDQKQKLKEERKLAEEAFAERERLRAEALEAAKIVSSRLV